MHCVRSWIGRLVLVWRLLPFRCIIAAVSVPAMTAVSAVHEDVQEWTRKDQQER